MMMFGLPLVGSRRTGSASASQAKPTGAPRTIPKARTAPVLTADDRCAMRSRPQRAKSVRADRARRAVAIVNTSWRCHALKTYRSIDGHAAAAARARVSRTARSEVGDGADAQSQEQPVDEHRGPDEPEKPGSPVRIAATRTPAREPDRDRPAQDGVDHRDQGVGGQQHHVAPHRDRLEVAASCLGEVVVETLGDDDGENDADQEVEGDREDAPEGPPSEGERPLPCVRHERGPAIAPVRTTDARHKTRS